MMWGENQSQENICILNLRHNKNYWKSILLRVVCVHASRIIVIPNYDRYFKIPMKMECQVLFFFPVSFRISRFDCPSDIYTVTYFCEMPYVNYSFHILHGDKIVILSYALSLFN